MTIGTSLARKLTDEERQALSRYGADSTYLHAVVQRREGDLQYHALYQDEWMVYAKQIEALDSAIGASTLISDSVLYSAQPKGFSVRGSFLGDAAKFVGLIYRYPGFISTSAETSFRDRFLSKRRDAGSRPATLEFRLPAGWNAIDLSEGGHSGEFEFLLARDVAYGVVDASYVDGDVLNLVLEPA